MTSATSPIYGPYTDSNTDKASVKALLSDLSSNSTQYNGFYNTVSGWGTANTIRGRILCRGDVALSTCQHCVSLAAKQKLRSCTNGTEFIIAYDLCMLHYTSRSFQFFNFLPGITSAYPNKTEISDKSRFIPAVLALSTNVTAKDANSTLPDKKFSTDEVTVTTTKKLYGLAQCMPD
ncbi:hypothetical protein QN277_001258 [Acacia crassicarpa]|uniref:Gnk2-homologous domain-containing protein n=1 Tax=Acacia crassicarpa TaxID=499986 RepID=A0AAE1N889_9FABA|nr:hypothetical protein QN277_001258 [Acacia crassicarpa]